jgi:hypothetical protein
MEEAKQEANNVGAIWAGKSVVNVSEVEIGGVLWFLLNILDRH